eukprot:ANDGO_03287.mRNA.1 GLE1 family protein
MSESGDYHSLKSKYREDVRTLLTTQSEECMSAFLLANNAQVRRTSSSSFSYEVSPRPVDPLGVLLNTLGKEAQQVFKRLQVEEEKLRQETAQRQAQDTLKQQEALQKSQIPAELQESNAQNNPPPLAAAPIATAAPAVPHLASSATVEMPSSRSVDSPDTPFHERLMEERKRAVNHRYQTYLAILDKQNEPQFKETVKSVRRLFRGILNTVTASRSKCKAAAEQVVSGLNELNRPGNEEGYDFSLCLVAATLIDQSVAYALKDDKLSFALGLVFCRVSFEIPDLAPVTLHLLNQVCPPSIPKLYRKKDFASEAAYLGACGYVKKEGNTRWETEAEYTLRMKAYVSFLFAIMRTPLYDINYGSRSGKPAVHPFGLEDAYMWLAATLNAVPTRISSLLLDRFLTLVGRPMSERFPRQFPKMCRFIATTYVPVLKTIGCVDAEISRIMAFIMQYASTNFQVVPKSDDEVIFDEESSTVNS